MDADLESICRVIDCLHGRTSIDSLNLIERNNLWWRQETNAIMNLIHPMDKPLESIVVLSQPRAGSTLLMRLVSNCSLKGVRGDMPIDYLEGVMKAWRAATQTKGQYGHMLLKFEESGIFPDEYRGGHSSHEWWCEWMNYHARVMLLGGSAGFMKTTQIGFGNAHVQDFVDMLRTILDNEHHSLKLVFLTRDRDEIIQSLQSKWKEKGLNELTDFATEVQVRSWLQHQREQFDEAAKLGDIKMDYHKFIADPKALLKRLGLDPERHSDTYQKIINNKLR